MVATKGLTREMLVCAALDIVDREGLGALSMRRLGAELGVDPMAAYRHLPNKEALLDGVVEAVMSQIDSSQIDPEAPWTDQLRELVENYMATLLAHPNAVPLVAERPLRTAGSLRMIEHALGIMTSAGVSLKSALTTINTIGLLTSGIAAAARADAPAGANPSPTGNTFSNLPASEFPLLLEAAGSMAESTGFRHVLTFAMDSMILRLQSERG